MSDSLAPYEGHVQATERTRVEFDVKDLVDDYLKYMNWQQMAKLAIREVVMELVRAIDFKPIIQEAVAQYVKETVPVLDINGRPVQEHVKTLMRGAITRLHPLERRED